MADHVVVQGECIESIAFEYGFFWQTLWDLPDNQALRDARKDPNALYEGDVVRIPDKRTKDASVATGGSHRFKRKGVPARLDVVLKWADEPRANEPYELHIDGELAEKGTTAGDGRVKYWISPKAREAKLVVGKDARRTEYVLPLGHMDPFDEITGIKQRLKNLGHYYGEIDDRLGDELIDALVSFQESAGLEPTGATGRAGKRCSGKILGMDTTTVPGAPFSICRFPADAL
jgi:N-acetylmuramoyl-L-alanine amidase